MMRFLTHYAVCTTFVLFGTALSLLAQTPSAPKKSPGGTLTGKVTIKGKAASGVVVGVRVSQPTTPYEVTYKGVTDLNGKYRINDVPSGSYELAPVAPAFVISDSINPRGQTVVLNEGETVDGIDFALLRGGVITGKVTDADGRAVVEQSVSLISADPQTNQRFTTYPVTSVQTDDRGIYRMFGLIAGRYKVFVGQGQETIFMGGVAGRPSYPQRFHSDAADAAKADIVEVTEGTEASNIDITLGRASQTYAANGRVINGETGRPIANERLGLQLLMGGQSGPFMGTTATSNSQGEFRLENLAPGKYALMILPQPDSGDRAERVPFEIVDQDVSDLLIKTSTGAMVAGTIVLENVDDKAAWSKLLQLVVQGFVQNESATGNIAHQATINADGSFLIKGLEAGTAYLMLGARGDRAMLKGFTITRTERDGIVQTRGLEIRNGDQVAGVKVVVSYGNATIHGLVRAENGTLPVGARISVRVTKPGQNGIVQFRPPQVDARGHFIVEGLPAGTYDISVAVVDVSAPGRKPINAKQQISVSDGVINDVTIAVDLSQGPGPPSP